MTLRVVALDPGGTTGWAMMTKEESAEPGWECGQLPSPEHHQTLSVLLGHMQTDQYYIVCESFEYRNQSRAGLDLSSKEYIGVAKLFSQERNVTLWMQTAAMAKGFVKDTHIKKLGLWSPGDKHAMDAYRHLIYFLVNGEPFKGTATARYMLDRAYK